jgi:hypothetical protein
MTTPLPQKPVLPGKAALPMQARIAQAPLPDPTVGVVYTGDLEQDATAELTALQKGFRDRAAQEQARYWQAVDSEHWICVCFKTREAKEEFLRTFNLLQHGDKYLDGDKVARTLTNR